MDIPLRIAELDHVVLRCRDQPKMLDFYIRILGLREERRIEAMGLIQLRAGASMIDLVPAATPRIESGSNVDHFCLGVEAADMAATARYLSDNGVEVANPPAMRYGARGLGISIYIRDPEGNVLELKQISAVSRS